VHPPGLLLRSNGFLGDGAVAAAAKAAAAAAGRESQQREHAAGSPLDVLKAALDGAAAHVAAPRGAPESAAEVAEPAGAEPESGPEPESDAQSMEELFQIVQVRVTMTSLAPPYSLHATY
jgi:hypothetical protein